MFLGLRVLRKKNMGMVELMLHGITKQLTHPSS
jgi:hypothetical protein